MVGAFCRRWGVPLIDGETVRLPKLIGLSRALDLILAGGRPRNHISQHYLTLGISRYMQFLLILQDHHIYLELRVKYKLPQDVWWPAMEKVI